VIVSDIEINSDDDEQDRNYVDEDAELEASNDEEEEEGSSDDDLLRNVSN
jgi:hypothetical protein